MFYGKFIPERVCLGAMVFECYGMSHGNTQTPKHYTASTPAIVAVIMLASVAASTAFRPSCASSVLREGASGPMPPICMAIEEKLAKPQSANVAMITVPAPIEDNANNTRCLRSLGKLLANGLAALESSSPTDVALAATGLRQRVAGDVVDELGVNELVGTKNT